MSTFKRKLENIQEYRQFEARFKEAARLKFDTAKILGPVPVRDLLEQTADQIGTSVQALTAGLLASVAACVGPQTTMKVHDFGEETTQVNLYSLFVAPPAGGKSKAFKHVVEGPLRQLEEDKELSNFLVMVSPTPTFFITSFRYF